MGCRPSEESCEEGKCEEEPVYMGAWHNVASILSEYLREDGLYRLFW